ncbi:MAG: transketolase [Elusimicrobia bacterium]|nr:transketolase [Elusimicrobiota bacterium]
MKQRNLAGTWRRVGNRAMLKASLGDKARQIRATCVQMAYDGKMGHLGSALSCVDAIVALYHDWLRVSPATADDPDRDRFILSKGHACTAHYAVLADLGFVPKDCLSRYAVMNQPMGSHPCKHALPLLECSTGSLGHGLGIASGMLYGLRHKRSPARVAVLLGDGECNEGSVWEAAMFCAAQKLDGLLAMVDYNRLQAVGRTDQVNGHSSLEEKFRSFGWGARTIDGNAMGGILDALDRFPLRPGRPTALILRTVKGAGVSFMEDQVLWHYRVPSAEDLARALEELKAAPLHLEGSER